MSDAVTLTVPNERRFFGVVRLVLGGLGARLDLPYEQIDDLQLAVESVLLRAPRLGSEVTLELSIDEDTVGVCIGPLGGEALDEDPSDPAQGLGLRRLLGVLVDEVDLLERSDRHWLRLEKRVLSSAADPA